MTALHHLAAWFACTGFLMFSTSASADDAPRLPHPRPAIEGAMAVGQAAAPGEADARLPQVRPPANAQAGLGEWAEDLQSRFRVAAAELEDVPAVQQTIPADVSAFTAIEQLARLPHPRPEHATEMLARAPPNAPVETPAAPLAPRVPEPEDLACLARLDALGVAYTKEEPIEPDGLCFVDHPLKVTSVGSGVAIVPEAIMNCATAEALAEWTKTVLVPSARDLLGATPNRIVHGSTYVCRTRNGEPGAKLSEHAHANAVDIASIAFAERQPLDIQDREMSLAEGQFQFEIRKGSCGYFTTVLGPRSDAAHAGHFHFDMAERRGGYRLCDLAETDQAGAVEP
jgi:hypothetical protein